MKLHPQEYLKALVAALVAGLSVLAGAAGDGISVEEWLTAAVALLVAFGATFTTPNRPPRGSRRRPDQSEQAADAGLTLVEALVVVLVVVVVLLLLGFVPR